MTLASWLATWKTRLEHHQSPRMCRRDALRNPVVARLRLEQLEERLALSGSGSADGAYIVEPWSGNYIGVKIQPTDQKIVAAGGTSSGVAMARYDSVGNPDASYGAGGLSTPPSPGKVYDTAMDVLTLQSDGKAVVASTFQPPGATAYLGVERFNTNGSLDKTFGSGGWTSVNADPGYGQIASGVGVQTTGQIVVGGWSGMYRSTIMGGFKANGAVNSGKGGFGDIVHNQATGSTANTFGAPYADFTSILVQPLDNKIVAVGDFRPTYVVAQVLVARYTANGALDTAFNGSGYTILTLPGINYTSSYHSLGTLQSDGKIVVVSNALAVGGEDDLLVTRFNANGTLDISFGGGTGYVRLSTGFAYGGLGVAIQPDGKIIAVDEFAGSPNTVVVARLNSNGTLDSTFGAGGLKFGTQAAASGFRFKPSGVALESDGSIIIAGTENYQGTGDTHPFLMRFFGSTPQLGSFTASPSPVTAGITVTLTALNITDANPGSTITQVDIYQDTNGDGVLETGTDQLLGNATQSSPGTWTRTWVTTGVSSGTYTFFAVALDNHGLFSDPMATSEQVL